MQVRLVVVAGTTNTSSVELHKFPTVIGRSREAGLTVAHPLISRRHCEISENDGLLMIRDLGSLNGTHFGGARIREAALSPNAEFTVGPLTFRAEYDYDGDLTELPPVVPHAASEPDATIGFSVPVDSAALASELPTETEPDFTAAESAEEPAEEPAPFGFLDSADEDSADENVANTDAVDDNTDDDSNTDEADADEPAWAAMAAAAVADSPNEEDAATEDVADVASDDEPEPGIAVDETIPLEEPLQEEENNEHDVDELAALAEQTPAIEDAIEDVAEEEIAEEPSETLAEMAEDVEDLTEPPADPPEVDDQTAEDTVEEATEDAVDMEIEMPQIETPKINTPEIDNAEPAVNPFAIEEAAEVEAEVEAEVADAVDVEESPEEDEAEAPGAFNFNFEAADQGTQPSFEAPSFEASDDEAPLFDVSSTSAASEIAKEPSPTATPASGKKKRSLWPFGKKKAAKSTPPATAKMADEVALPFAATEPADEEAEAMVEETAEESVEEAVEEVVDEAIVEEVSPAEAIAPQTVDDDEIPDFLKPAAAEEGDDIEESAGEESSDEEAGDDDGLQNFLKGLQ